MFNPISKQEKKPVVIGSRPLCDKMIVDLQDDENIKVAKSNSIAARVPENPSSNP